KAMKMFKRKGGCLVELGVQSLDKGVLRKIKREMPPDAVKKAVRIIKKAGLKLGVQVMLGLPGDTLEKSIATAEKLIKLKPETARIYPTLVIKGTELARQYKKGIYKPLTPEEAIEQSSTILDIFEKRGIKVIRIGLHPSKDLDSKSAMIAGPYHHAFGEMTRARSMRNKILDAVKDRYVANRSHIEIHAPRKKFNLISGHKGREKRFLEEYFKVPVLLRSNNILQAKSRRYNITVKDVRKDIALIDPRMPKAAKEKLKKMNYYLAEVPLHKKLPKPIKGHVDMMFFKTKDLNIYEPSLENIAKLLRQNGHKCVKGSSIKPNKYPKDILYNACSIGKHIIHYHGKIEKKIKEIKANHIPVAQGYTKCSIIPVDNKHIITSDPGVKKEWEKRGGKALLISPGYIKLPGYKTGLIGGATGVTGKAIFFVGTLSKHPDGSAMREFIKKAEKSVIELYKGPLYDTGTIFLFEAKPRTVLKVFLGM
ncbi:MAG: radical SAM protein, partial [Candidatus Omnitrophica bacterium]|nr:radical SAM protein [Candidatus Omnitrophota bacterium]